MDSLIGSKLAEVLNKILTGNKLVQFQVKFISQQNICCPFLVNCLNLGYRKDSFKPGSASF